MQTECNGWLPRRQPIPINFSEILVETNMENAHQSSQGAQPSNETPFRTGTPQIAGEHFSGGFAGSRYADVDVTDRRHLYETLRVTQLRMAGRMAQLELRAQMESSRFGNADSIGPRASSAGRLRRALARSADLRRALAGGERDFIL